MSIDVVGNFLTIIRNGVMASKASVVAPYSKLKFEIARILKEEGFIRGFELLDENSVKKKIRIFLKYKNNESTIHEIKRASRPGRRYYTGVDEIVPVIDGLGISIISTNKGLLSDKQAKKAQVGGEIICTVW